MTLTQKSFPATLVPCCLFLISLYFPKATLGGVIQLPQTGQTTCYNTEGNVIPCAGSGQDGDIRAGVPWPDPRFTVNRV